MVTCVALLRGINVGGRSKVRMADLRQVCAELGLGDVRTHVQSGNVVFTTDARAPERVGPALTLRMEDELGVAPTVVVRTAEELARVVAENPFSTEAEVDPTTVHVAFLTAEPTDPSVLEFDPGTYAPERIAAGDRVRYLLLPAGIGRSRLATDLARRRTDVEMTVRNWRTVSRLLAMTNDDA